MIKFFPSRWYVLLTVVIIVMAAGLRLYRLGDVPHGMTWDEAAIGYNGYAVVTTRRDEWLQKLPVSFRSFGDYKAPAAIYLNGIFTSVWGMNLWAVRLPFAVAGIFGVWGMILLIREWGRLYHWGETESRWLALVGGLMMATSPWHLHYSRVGFESGLALTLLIWGTYWLLKAFARSTVNLLALSAAGALLVGTVYTYHSAKIVAPLLVVTWVWQFRRHLWSNFKKIALVGSGGLLLLYPLIKDSLYGKGLERAGTLIISHTNSVGEFLSVLTSQFLAHLSPLFLVLGETHTLRHGDGQWGVLLLPVFLLVVIGFFGGWRSKIKTDWIMSLVWMAVGILPAALGSELVPHSNRALLALPGIVLVALTGLRILSQFVLTSKINQKIKGSHGEANMVWVSIMGLLLFLHLLLFTRYLKDYYQDFARASAADFSDGYLEAFNFVKAYEPQVEKILFTSEYGQPYIFALFARRTNPIWYQGGSLVKYEFSDRINVGDLSRTKAVIVAGQSNSDLPEKDAQKLIYGSDGQVRFKIYLR